jgi:glucose 1-dehydrogenase
MPISISLAGQKALVTGASSGIGSACAIALAEAGAAVAVNFRSNESGAAEVVEQIRGSGGEAIAVGADVSKQDEVRFMFEKTIETFGTLDILVSNAGLQEDATFADMSLEQWQKVIDVNLTGQFLCAKEAVAEFRRRGVIPEVSRSAGKIICMSSVHERIAWAGHVNYAASKGGVRMFAESLAQELAPHRIRVNSVAPGAIRTPINRGAWETDKAYNDLMDLIPYNRIGEPEEIGRAVAWLASDESDYLVGTTLFIDGGMTLYPSFADGG